jgi:hypothetical protein
MPSSASEALSPAVTVWTQGLRKPQFQGISEEEV